MTGTPPASRTSLRARGRSRGEQLPLWHPSTPGSSPGASARCVGSMPEAADAVRYTPNDGPSLPDPPRPGGLPRCPDRGEFSVPIRIHPARRIPLSQTAWPWIADGGVQADEEPTYPDPGPVGALWHSVEDCLMLEPPQGRFRSGPPGSRLCAGVTPPVCRLRATPVGGGDPGGLAPGLILGRSQTDGGDSGPTGAALVWFSSSRQSHAGGGGRVPGRRTQPGSCDVERPPGVRLR